MRRECGLDQCICLLLHLIWTHMQVGVREGGTKPSILTSKKKIRKEKKKKQHSLHMNPNQINVL